MPRSRFLIFLIPVSSYAAIHGDLSDYVNSDLPLENAGVEQGLHFVVIRTIVSNKLLPQKYRLFVLESEKGTDIVAYVLAFFIDIKDKPRKSTYNYLCGFHVIHLS